MDCFFISLLYSDSLCYLPSTSFSIIYTWLHQTKNNGCEMKSAIYSKLREREREREWNLHWQIVFINIQECQFSKKKMQFGESQKPNFNNLPLQWKTLKAAKDIIPKKYCTVLLNVQIMLKLCDFSIFFLL